MYIITYDSICEYCSCINSFETLDRRKTKGSGRTETCCTVEEADGLIIIHKAFKWFFLLHTFWFLYKDHLTFKFPVDNHQSLGQVTYCQSIFMWFGTLSGIRDRPEQLQVPPLWVQRHLDLRMQSELPIRRYDVGTDMKWGILSIWYNILNYFKEYQQPTII